jgi:membrane associated rhomboid family serine protease
MPLVTVALIAACVVTFLWQVSQHPQAQQAIIYALGVIPVVLLGDAQLPDELRWIPPGATILTSMFLHGGWMHLIGNMLYLWIFGNNVEDAMGHPRYLAFYFLCGALAVFAQALPEPGSQIPMVGASGAISGVLGAYWFLHPHARILVVVPLGFLLHSMQLRAGVVLGLWFAIQLVSSLAAQPGQGGVAFRAHIGGFVGGMVLVWFFKRRGVRLHPPWRS